MLVNECTDSFPALPTSFSNSTSLELQKAREREKEGNLYVCVYVQGSTVYTHTRNYQKLFSLSSLQQQRLNLSLNSDLLLLLWENFHPPPQSHLMPSHSHRHPCLLFNYLVVPNGTWYFQAYNILRGSVLYSLCLRHN